MSILSSIFKVGAPILGGVIGGPGGAAAGAGLSGLLSGGESQGQSDKLRQQALDIANREWSANQPLRDRARSMALGPQAQRPDLSGVFQSQNPFSHPAPGGMPAPGPQPGGGMPQPGGISQPPPIQQPSPFQMGGLGGRRMPPRPMIPNGSGVFASNPFA